jgi:hypothetical protein
MGGRGKREGVLKKIGKGKKKNFFPLSFFFLRNRLS